MVTDAVWRASKLPKRWLVCRDCLAAALGRPLVRADYLECPLNRMNGLLCKTVEEMQAARRAYGLC
jgi:hypothetical protein